MPANSAHASRSVAQRHHWFLYVIFAFFVGLLTFAGARAQTKASDDATFRKLIDGYCSAWSSGDPNNDYTGLIAMDTLTITPAHLVIGAPASALPSACGI